MHRRTFLTGVVIGSISASGCLGNVDNPSSDSGRNTGGDDQSDPVEFEQCENRIVQVDSLPPPIYEEATAALDDDVYETDDELLLSSVVKEDAYLHTGDEYYTIEIVDEEDTTVLALEESVPVFTEDVFLENQTNAAVEFELVIKRRNSGVTIVEATLTLDAGERVVLSDGVEFYYGKYRAEVDGEEFPEDGSREVTWELNQDFETGYAYPIHIDENGIFIDPVDQDSSFGPCSWDETGDVSTGH